MKKNRINIIGIIIFFCISLFSSCEKFDVPKAIEYEGVKSTRIWSTTGHSAFTSMVEHNGYKYISFREAPSHIGAGGIIRIIRSQDDVHWESIQTLKLESTSSGGGSNTLSFSGNYQNMVIPHHTDFDFTADESFTFTAYVSVDNQDATRFIVSNRNGGDGYALGINKGGQLFVDMALPYILFYQSPNIFKYSEWKHVAFVYNGTNKAFSMYQDGVLCNIGVYPTGKTFEGQANTYGNDICIFSKAPNHITSPLAHSTYTKGIISFVRFWDKALTLDEIVADKNAIVNSSTANLIAGYDLGTVKEEDGKYYIPDVKGNHRAILRNFSKDDLKPPTDLRDPKLIITDDNRIMLITDGEFYNNGKVVSRRPYVAFSDTNGENFSELKRSDVYHPTEDVKSNSNFWMWSLINNKGTYYGFDYLHFQLFKSSDQGKTFYPLTKFNKESIGEDPSEVALITDTNDKMYAFIRRANANGYLGTSLPPYASWEFKELNYRLEGQFPLLYNNDKFIIGTRAFDENGATYTAIYITDLQGNRSKEIKLPSGGDTSYPGLVLDNEYLSVSYYSSHEGRTSIYFTKIPLSDLN